MTGRIFSGALCLCLMLGGTAGIASAMTPEGHFNRIGAKPRPVIQAGIEINRNIHIERVFSRFVVRGEDTVNAPYTGVMEISAGRTEPEPRPDPAAGGQLLPHPRAK